MSDASGVDVHEVGAGIVADAPQLQRCRCIAQVLELDAGHTNVDRFALDVQAVSRDATVGAAAFLQHRIGLWRAISGNDVEGLVATQAAVQRKEQIEQLWIDGLDRVDTEVPKQQVDLAERAGHVVPGATIRGRQPLVRVRMKERERPLGREPRRGRGETTRKRTSGHERRGGGSGGKTEKRTPAQLVTIAHSHL
jgi:hypothetical protein